MKIYYDFHIHTCLSPCGDTDMTPNNIVNMSLIKGLNAIAITDHNHAGNVEACIKAAENTGLIVIGGMEVETSEEIHMIVLFEDLSKLYMLEEYIQSTLPNIKNKPEIFGEQYIMNSEDEVVALEERYLITACGVDVYTLYNKVSELGGIIFPAHIDKSSYSIISNLGMLPPELKFSALEVKRDEAGLTLSNDYLILRSSDAHYLWDISEKEHFLELEGLDLRQILLNLKQK